MVTTIQEILRPLLLIWFIVGLGIYPAKKSKQKNRWIVYLSILYSLTVWFVYGCLYYYVTNIYSLKKIFGTTSNIVTSISILATIISVIVSLSRRKKFEICIKKLAAVDDTLEKLGTPKMYQKVYIWSKRVVIGWIVCSVIINFYDTLWWYRTEKNILLALLLSYLMSSSTQVMIFMDLIFIFILCHLHLELCRTARELNLMFGAQLTLEMISSLLNSTVLCYYLCIVLHYMYKYQLKFLSYNELISLSSWFFISLMRLFIINYVFERVKSKADKVGKILHQLTNVLRYIDLYMEIHQFILQTMQQPLKFTGMGLFNFGNVFFGKFCITVLMYVIIMTQMNIS